MPRPTKQTVDYFPHYVTDSKTKFLLENRWGNDGYAVWFKILEILCKTDGHACHLNDPLDWDYFIHRRQCDVPKLLPTVFHAINSACLKHRTVNALQTRNKG